MVFYSFLFRKKRILHIGCAGSDVYKNTDNHLHTTFIRNGFNVDGFDINVTVINVLKKRFPNHDFFSDFSEFKNNYYDLILVPEVLEHVDNARDFLDSIFEIKSKSVFITVPNFGGALKHIRYENNHTIELVHPEHYYWFSPYTLYNITKKYHKDVVNMYYLNRKLQVGIEIIK